MTGGYLSRRLDGHNDGSATTEALRRYDFDTVLMALNAAQSANRIANVKMERIPAFKESPQSIALEKEDERFINEVNGHAREQRQRRTLFTRMKTLPS